MTNNKIKMILGDCTFKPETNRMTKRQRKYRESRFVSKDPEIKGSFVDKAKRAQTADAKK